MERFAVLEGAARTGPAYFLPWRTDFGLAQNVGLIPGSAFSACYRLPDDVVCADPQVCADRISDVAEIAIRRACVNGAPSVIVGYSIGTVPATLVAATLGAPLWSFASADRGDLMIWSSPAARAVRREAERLGFSRQDFSVALGKLNPIDLIDHVHPDSRIVVGRYDSVVPRVRSRALVERARGHLPEKHVMELPLGHLGVLAVSPWLQRGWTLHA